ncbi:MAG: hypothetical protein RBU30_09205 [Polyangia bacterium]|nr:hypothetical protein [Polyangia bacterium]
MALIIGLALVVAAAASIRSLDTVNTRTAARFMASTLRFGHDRSRAMGRDHRLIFDLDAEGGTTVRIEIAEKGTQLMPRDLDEAWKQHQALSDGDQNEEDLETTTKGGLSKNLLALPRPTGPQWSEVKLRTKQANEQLAKSGRLVKSIYLPRLQEEITEGKVTLHIWSGGRVERAAIYISDPRDRTYTLITYPLTGRVKIHDGRVDLPRDLEKTDDLGEAVEGR